MDKFEEAICEHNPLYKEGLQDKYYQGAKWAWQSRQAEVDQLKGLLEKDEYAHSLYYENENLKAGLEEKDKRIETALALIDTTSYSEIQRRMPDFIDQLKVALRGEHE